MSDTSKKYTLEQLAIIAAFAEYGIESADILFYSDKAEPFFTYEATAALCNILTNIKDIEPEPITVFPETTAIRCRLVFPNGNSRCGVGIVNHRETLDDLTMNDHQRLTLASARAIRNALKASGINLLKAHLQLQQTKETVEPTLDMLRTKQLRECHALGEDLGFIYVENATLGNINKTAWYNVISKRYGKHSSGELSNNELADFIAFLRSCLQKAA